MEKDGTKTGGWVGRLRDLLLRHSPQFDLWGFGGIVAGGFRAGNLGGDLRTFHIEFGIA